MRWIFRQNPRVTCGGVWRYAMAGELLELELEQEKEKEHERQRRVEIS
jgi:hypothetical protein